MNETPSLIPIPPGFVCIKLSEYDNLHDRLTSVKADLYEEIRRRDKDIGKLHEFLEEKQNEILMLHDQIEENKHTIDTMRNQIFALSTVKEDLMRDLDRRDKYLKWLNDEENYLNWVKNHHIWDGGEPEKTSPNEEPINAALEEVRG